MDDTEQKRAKLLKQFGEGAKKDSTKMVYKQSVDIAHRDGLPEPCTDVELAEYLQNRKVYKMKQGKVVGETNQLASLSTLRTITSAFKDYYDTHYPALPNPAKSELVRLCLASAAKRPRPVKQARALSLDEIVLLVDTFLTPPQAWLTQGGFFRTDYYANLHYLQSARNKAWILLQFAAGCRVSEILNLQLRDVHFIEAQGIALNLRETKTRQNVKKFVRFEADAEYCPVAALRNWIAIARIKRQNAYLFPAIQGEKLLNNPVSQAQMNAALQRAAKEAGLSEVQRITTHSLRASLATALNGQGVDIADIAERLGHSKLDTTLGYIRRDEKTQLENMADLGLGKDKAVEGGFVGRVRAMLGW